MISSRDLKRYHRKLPYSYTFGPYPTFELLQCRPEAVEMVLVHSTLSREIREKLEDYCRLHRIQLMENDRLVGKLRDKESCLVIGVFGKYSDTLVPQADHVVLVNPSDSGNLGTIIRTCTGFGIHDLACIEPAVDSFHPKTVRASMGSLFHLHCVTFPSFAEYQKIYGAGRRMYPFMLKGAVSLEEADPGEERFSLIFGNESSGLPDDFLEVGQSVVIRHSKEIDSLNLSLAAGIGIYEFTKKARSRQAGPDVL